MELIIFEDDLSLAEQIKLYIQNHFNKTITVMLVTDKLNEVMMRADRGQSSGIYLLDIQIGKKDEGLIAAREIYSRNKENYIIIITQYAEKILFDTGMKLKAFNIILKHKLTFFKELSETLKYIIQNASDSTLLVYHDYYNEIRIAINGILYIEAVKGEHRVSIIHEREHYKVRLTLRDLVKQLDSRFVRCHNSCIVNLDKIQKVDFAERKIIMSNGFVCYYSFSYRKNFLKELQKRNVKFNKYS